MFCNYFEIMGIKFTRPGDFARKHNINTKEIKGGFSYNAIDAQQVAMQKQYPLLFLPPPPVEQEMKTKLEDLPRKKRHDYQLHFLTGWLHVMLLIYYIIKLQQPL